MGTCSAPRFLIHFLHLNSSLLAQAENTLHTESPSQILICLNMESIFINEKNQHSLFIYLFI